MMHTSVIHIFQEDKKTFQCKGYGNCRMVFTRSEHLARHQRKHTGEKPFDCIVPGCSRKFSRFDNMMQHTQTHHTTNDKQVPKLIQSKRKRTNSINNKSNNSNLTKKKKLDLLLDELFSLSDSSQLSSDEDEEDEELMVEKVQMKEQEQDAIIRHMMTLPHLANYLLDHPDEPPENYFFKYYYRLSKQDLLYPIDYFLSNHHQEQQSTIDDIYITLDEFEALQGLSRFYTCQK